MNIIILGFQGKLYKAKQISKHKLNKTPFLPLP